ncbi:MAG: hypothetical protein D6702_09120 [Planctomycetota bacterium]|nr:MAG: hypothetical protein D6702_09120 [Planctomycetota bacterium]
MAGETEAQRGRSERPQLVLCAAGLPAAEAARRVCAAWQAAGGDRPVTLVLVPAAEHAALVARLRPLILALPPAPAPAGFRARIRAALDDGGTLVAGGRRLPGGRAQPTLFLNLDPNARLLCDPAPAGPVLAVLRSEDGPRTAPGPRQQRRSLSEPNPDR